MTREDEIHAIIHQSQLDDDQIVTWVADLELENLRLREEISRSHIEISELNQQIGELKFDINIMVSALHSVACVINNSQGVTGWHMNGNIATWDELELETEVAEALANERKGKSS